jgi:DNA-binding NtrC family response regulator
MQSDQVQSRVLIADNERIIADSLALILRGRGYESRAVYSGEDAAELALEWKPDVVITDVVMGTMNGVALAIYLAQALPTCKVLLMSGNPAAEKLIEESESLGHDFPIVAKPVHPDRIFEFLKSSGIGTA